MKIKPRREGVLTLESVALTDIILNISLSYEIR